MVRSSSARPGGAIALGRPPARFTEQLVALVVPDRKDRVLALAETYGVSQASIMREIINQGLPLLERMLGDGKLDPATLA
jgi:hypothetical protein